MPKNQSKKPSQKSIDALINYLRSNNVVQSVQQVDSHTLIITRNRKTELHVFMTNAYIVGIAEIYEIMSGNSSVNAIVAMSEWNSYTHEAKEHCKQQNIGLFTFKEFLGAMYYNGKKFINYVPPRDRE
jgi:hypothetical protein